MARRRYQIKPCPYCRGKATGGYAVESVGYGGIVEVRLSAYIKCTRCKYWICTYVDPNDLNDFDCFDEARDETIGVWNEDKNRRE